MYRFVRKKMRPKRAMKPHAHATIVALRGPSLSEIVPNTTAAIAVPIMYAVIANPLVTVSKPASIARVGTMEANASVPVSSTMKMKKNQNVGVFSACLDVRPGRFFAARRRLSDRRSWRLRCRPRWRRGAAAPSARACGTR